MRQTQSIGKTRCSTDRLKGLPLGPAAAAAIRVPRRRLLILLTERLGGTLEGDSSQSLEGQFARFLGKLATHGLRKATLDVVGVLVVVITPADEDRDL